MWKIKKICWEIVSSTCKSVGLGDLEMGYLLHVLDGVLGSDHRRYNMKRAELFRNGKSKSEVLKETKK